MPKFQKIFASTVLLLTCCPIFAGPRDAAAVENRCGQPTLGDTTIYESHTVAGGRRILKYLRGTLNFDRVGNDGWTFTAGEHDKKTGLTAEAMAPYMPCLTLALADSVADAPLAPVSETSRLRTSVKGEYSQIILVALGGLALLIVGYGIFKVVTKNKQDEDDD